MSFHLNSECCPTGCEPSRRACCIRKTPHCVFLDFCDNAVEGIFQSTPDGHYLMVNNSLARMYGYSSPDELMASVNSIRDEVYADASVRDIFRRCIEKEGSVSGLEYQIKRKDGSLLWISEFSRVVRDAEGTILYYEGSIQDISARKKAEADRMQMELQLRQACKMEAVGTLAGGIAHDFNNLLAVIQGFSQLAIMDKSLSPATREYLSESLAATGKAAELVKQILSYSRKNGLERTGLHLKALVLEMQRLLRAGLPAKVTWESSFETENDTVRGNSTQFQQVLLNLCTNAGYAMREKGGRLRVVVADWKEPAPAGLPPGCYLELRVSDEGTGMSPQIIERVFDPFFTTKPRGEGTGLGLSVSLGIVNSHGGTILVESELGKGTTFRVLLPKNMQEEEKPALARMRVKGAGRILCVDDEESVLRMLQKHLRLLGYSVLTRADSQEALRTFKESPDEFDLVLTDMCMPGLSGTDLSLKVRELRPNTPVILCSGQVELMPQKNLSDFGIVCTIAKPVDFVVLSREIEKYCGEARSAKRRATRPTANN
jgi:PAS domain S-box-containing protein